VNLKELPIPPLDTPLLLGMERLCLHHPMLDITLREPDER
jgi:hypothetical protein